MACYHPLKGFVLGIKDNGKKDLIICSYDVVGVTRHPVHRVYESFLNDFNRKYYADLKEQGLFIDEFITIPCGQCIGCRLEYSRQWAIRCMLESEYHDHNYFITLTYDDDHVPKSGYIDDDGIFSDTLTLCMKDVQLFIKRLRSHFDYHYSSKFRYFYCGEYGTTTCRPHYHMIAFGLELNDLVLYKKSPLGDLYNSPTLDEIWGMGHVVIGAVTFESCAYVSRYIMKKQKGSDAQVYEQFNIKPEFVCMSRRPGIGRQYFDDNFEDIYQHDGLVLPGGKFTTPPRYFDSIMNEIDEQLMEGIKLKRRDIAESIQSYKDSLSDRDYLMQLEHAENNKAAQIKMLVRDLE